MFVDRFRPKIILVSYYCSFFEQLTIKENAAMTSINFYV